MVETLLQVAPHIKSWRNYNQKSLETIQDHCPRHCHWWHDRAYTVKYGISDAFCLTGKIFVAIIMHYKR